MSDSLKILNLGCGIKKETPGLVIAKGDKIVNLDMAKWNENVDVVWDLEKMPLPFKENEFDVIYTHHVMEHIRNLPNLIEDIYRILKPNGKFICIVPHFSGRMAYGDIEHRNFFSLLSFDKFSDKRMWEGSPYSGRAKFNILKKGVKFSPYLKPWEIFVNLFPHLWESTPLRTFFSASIIFELEAIK